MTELVARVVGEADGTALVLTDDITAAAPDRIGPDGIRVEDLADAHPVLVARAPPTRLHAHCRVRGGFAPATPR